MEMYKNTIIGKNNTCKSMNMEDVFEINEKSAVLMNLETNDCNELLNMFSSISMMNHKPLNLYSQIWLCI